MQIPVSHTSPASVCILEEIWVYKMKELCSAAFSNQSSSRELSQSLDALISPMFQPNHSWTRDICVSCLTEAEKKNPSPFCRVVWVSERHRSYNHGRGRNGPTGSAVWANFGESQVSTCCQLPLWTHGSLPARCACVVQRVCWKPQSSAQFRGSKSWDLCEVTRGADDVLVNSLFLWGK